MSDGGRVLSGATRPPSGDDREVNWLRRSWAALVGAPARALARRLSSRFPRASHDGIDLVVGDPRLVEEAEHFFTATVEALRYAAARAPTSYARLRQDVKTIVMRRESAESPYHRFQLAVLVPANVALEADAVAYAAWLLHASGLSRDPQEAAKRTSEILKGMNPDQQDRVRAWLPSTDR
jgi:hypothetical protein